jgi:5'-3' exonuclease
MFLFSSKIPFIITIFDIHQIIFNDSNVPGEGEHKFLSILRLMRTNPLTKNEKIYVYGGDADLIVLSICTHKTNIHIIREVKNETVLQMKKMYEAYEFLKLDIDELRKAFYDTIASQFKNEIFDKENILNDYMFLTFLVGNDFVLSLPFLKIKKDGLDVLISIYLTIKKTRSDYLTQSNEEKIPQVNSFFLTDLMHELSLREDSFMKEHQHEINKLVSGFKSTQTIESERDKTPFEIFQSRYFHLQVCQPDHPLFSKYKEEFKKIKYDAEYEVWKEQYYQYYFYLNKQNVEEYTLEKNKIVTNYVESLLFTLQYYYKGCPSWSWHYKYRVPPLFSDVYEALSKNTVTIQSIQFDQGIPYTPFQQLMLILPPQMNFLLPSSLQTIMNDDSFLCTQFYPTSFYLDVTAGIKTIYSEAILPEIDDELLIKAVKKQESKLTEEEKERNSLQFLPKKFVPK